MTLKGEKEIEFATHKECLNHEPGYDHPENSTRLKIILEWLKTNHIAITDNCEQATKEDILRVHSADLFARIEQTQSEIVNFTEDTSSNQHTFPAALSAAGVAIYGVQHSKTTHHSVFGLIRPPGHHATKNQAMGFCYFNNAAIAAEYAIHMGKKRVAIVDFDNHYGNGTADIFQSRPDVLYISSHGHPNYCYPGQGYVDDIGEGEGKGFNIALPLLPRTGDNDVIWLYDSVVTPILQQFRPELILVSAGFDAFIDDPVGILGFTEKAFSYFGQLINSISSELNIPVVNLLEGGYNIQKLPDLLKAYLSGFTPQFGGVSDIKRIEEPSAYIRDLKVELKQNLANYWEF